MNAAFEPVEVWSTSKGDQLETYEAEVSICKPGETTVTRHTVVVLVRTTYRHENNNALAPRVRVEWARLDQDNLGITMPMYLYYNLTGIGAAYNFLLWALCIGGYHNGDILRIQRREA